MGIDVRSAVGRFHRAGPTTAHSGHRERWVMRRELTYPGRAAPR